MIKLFNVDYLDGIKYIKHGIIDLIYIDIPYKISRDNNIKTMKDRQGRYGIDFGRWDREFDEYQLSKLVPLLKEGGSLVIWSSFEQFTLLRNIFSDLIFKDKIIWEKTNPMPRNRDRRYISNIEMCSWYVKKGKWTFNRQSDKYQGSVVRYPSESGGGFKRYHPTQKNLKMVEQQIKIHSNKNDLVLDVVMGGGTTGAACKNLGRRFIGFEIDEKYFKIAEKRIND